MIRYCAVRAVAKPRTTLLRAVRFNSTNRAKNGETTVKFSEHKTDPNADILFQYTLGRWLKDNEDELAKRVTRFSIPALAELVKELGSQRAGKAPIDADTEIVQLVSTDQGKHHHVYRIDLSDGRQYTLRLPYSGLSTEMHRKKRLQSEVATMDFVRRKVAPHHHFEVPQVHSWSATAGNPLGHEYILMDFMAGREPQVNKHFRLMHDSQEQRVAQLTPLVTMYASLLMSTQFNRFGSLYFTDDVCSRDQAVLPYDNEPDSSLVDRWRIGPTTESVFWKNSLPEDSALRGPWDTAEDYFRATADIKLANLVEQQAKGSADPAVVASAMSTYFKYSTLCSQVPLRSEVDNDTLFSARMYYPDLIPSNILVETDAPLKDSAVAVVDFEGTSIRPALLHSLPHVLPQPADKFVTTDEIPNYHQLPDGVKRYYNHVISANQCLSTFKQLVNNAAPEFADIFSSRVTSLVEPMKLALKESFVEDHLLVSSSMSDLQGKWTGDLKMDCEYPLDWSDVNKEQLAKEKLELSQKSQSEPFRVSKGYLPHGMFNHFVNKGLIIPGDNGSYSFRAPS